jgi:DNA topoisomerase-3
VAGELFYAKGKIIKSKGWKAVYDGQSSMDEDKEDEEKDQSLPHVKKGDSVKVAQVRAESGKTKPPARYNEATLLSAMENPGKHIENAALREAMDEANGLGTPATRADIIEKLFDSFYMERRGKEIIPTSKGIQLIELVPVDLKSAELTAKWEMQLSKISKGREDANAFVGEMKKYASKLVSNITSSKDVFKHDNITREKCPECGKYLLDVNGKKGRMLVCQDRECRFRKTVSVVSNARCPQCHKKMEVKGEGDNKSFYCACGYREKLDEFKKRKGGQVNKKEVSSFLKQQDTHESINNALAEALSKFKL